MSWVYIRSEGMLWTVGFYDPAGEFQSDSDHATPEAAAARVHYLNGGCSIEGPAPRRIHRAGAGQ